MKTLLKTAIISIFSLSLPGIAIAQAEPKDLNQLLQQVIVDQKQQATESKDRLAKFKSEKTNQAKLLQEAKAGLKTLEQEGAALKNSFDANEKRLAQAEENLKITMGTMGELFGVVRQIAADTKAQFENSITSAQFPNRIAFLSDLAARKEIPNSTELNKLWFELFHEIVLSGQVTKFEAPVTFKDGSKVPTEVVRIGLFNTVADGKFLHFVPETGQLTELGRQPNAKYRQQAEDLQAANTGHVRFAIDPSRGSILSLLVQAPSLKERVEQGGVVGYVILGLLVIGFLIVLERSVYLFRVSRKIKSQAGAETPNTDNPLGQLLKVYDDNQAEDVENLELKLNEVILKSLPPLERGIKTVKLLAAIAPLLGLLGTVTGMIGTFQSITLFGTGDPKLMAGGISQALVTTVLGLVAAIPLLLLHSYISGKSSRIVEFLEEQSAGIIALRADKQPALGGE